MLYLFENYALDTDRRELRCGEMLVRVEPQVFDLIAFLVRNRDRVVSKDDLLASVWDGRVVSESTLSTRIAAARNAIGDNGEAQRLIKTLPRKGIRFTGSVGERPSSVRTNPTNDAPPASVSGATVRVGAPTVDQIQPDSVFGLPDRPSIAVIPFTNMSGDAQQEYFADGIVEDIITALSRFPSLFVIARNSSFTYKGRPVRIKDVGRELGVRYVLEGSVRKAGNRVRITGQLIHAETGAHVWTERYDGEFGDIFALQDEMTASIVGALVPSLQKAEIERARHKATKNLDAYDLYLRGLAGLYARTRQGNDEALKFADHALQLDPNFVSAVILAENCWGRRYAQTWSPLPEAVAQLTRYAQLAVQLDPNSAEALAVWSRRIPFIKQDYAEAISVAERAVAINPNSAFAWRNCGFALVYSGEAQRALTHFERALRLSPHDPASDDLFHGIGLALIQLERHKEAVGAAQRSVQHNANYAAGWRTLTAALALSDQMTEARKALHRTLELDPACSISTMLTRVGYSEKARALLFEGWRKAGMPE